MRRPGSAWVIAASLAAGSCGGGGSTAGPSGPGPASSPTPPPAGSQLQIHTRVAMLRVGERESITLTVSGGGDVTGLARVESSDPAVFVVEGDRRLLAVGPGEAQIRASYQGLTQSIPQVVVAIGPTPNAAPSLRSAAVVINEFRTSGPRGPADEFIELRNVSPSPVDLASWSIALVTASGHRESMGFIPGPAVVNPGCHFLLAGHSGPNAYSSGSLATGDFRWASAFFEDDVSFALLDPEGRIVDQVGLGTAPLYGEAEPLPPLLGRSYERVQDTNANAADFRPSSADSPRNRQSTCG